jgi:phosphatidylglycerophosphatase GEP4
MAYSKADNIEREMGIKVLRHWYKKPMGGSELLSHWDLKKSKQVPIIVVGDRVLTDVVYGNLNGALTILVTDIVTEKGDNWIAARVGFSLL